MPVSKPIQIYESPNINTVRRARSGARGSSVNSKLGGGAEAFAKVLAADPQSAEKLTGTARPGVPAVNRHGNKASEAIMHAAGLDSTNSVNIRDQGGLESLQKAMLQSRQPLATAGSIETFDPGLLQAMPIPARGLTSVMDESAVLAIKAASHRKSAKRTGSKAKTGENTDQSATQPTDRADTKSVRTADQPFGALSGLFESGGAGSMAIGYDATGGTSYGKYQIASKTGTFDEFMKFLTREAPDIAEKLKTGGPANTGSRSGKMPGVWREVAAEQPERFEALQHDFIKNNHFDPAMRKLSERTGVDENALSPVLKDVLFSTAVQHGAAAAGRIMDRALKAVGLDKFASEDSKVAQKAEREVIRQVYDMRSTQFGSSTSAVRSAVQNRLKSEMSAALNMLGTSRLA